MTSPTSDQPDPAAPNRCGGTNRQGRPCGKPAGFGTDHVGWGNCKFHGGSTPSGRVQAAKLEAAARAIELGGEVPMDAGEAMTWSMQVMAGQLRWLQDQVKRLDELSLDDRLGRAGMARALEQAAERLAKVSKLALDAKVDARRLELDALLLDRIDGAIKAAITDAGLGAEDTERLKAALGSRFRELADADASVPATVPATRQVLNA